MNYFRNIRNMKYVTLRIEPVVGVYMVSLIYGFNTNRIETNYEFEIGYAGIFIDAY